MNRRSGSTLFLMEQLIVIAVFALCAAACVSILTISFIYARDSRNMSRALLVAESAADSFKALSGDALQTADVLNGFVDSTEEGDFLTVYFDENWQAICRTDTGNIQYVLRMSPLESISRAGIAAMQLSVEVTTGDSNGNEEILTFPVVARTTTHGQHFLLRAGGFV